MIRNISIAFFISLPLACVGIPALQPFFGHVSVVSMTAVVRVLDSAHEQDNKKSHK